MFKNYILIAWRSLGKNKLFAFINIFGLALSMSVCMIVLIRITDAFAYDNFHPDGENIYRIISNIENAQGNKWKFASTPLPLKDALTIDSLAQVTHFYPAINVTATDGTRSFQVKGAFIEPTFFDVFGFSIKAGNPSTMAMPHQVLISASIAEKFYGDVNPVGKSLRLGSLGDFQIAGIVDTPTAKSHINYEIFVSLATVPLLERLAQLPAKIEDWNSFEQGYTYLKLHSEKHKEAIETRLAAISDDITRNAQAMNNSEKAGRFSFELQPLSSITPGPDIHHDIGRGPSRGSLLGEAGIVLIILLAACFNYANLSLARALTRAKEVGIRKLSGAQRWQIFLQYITEATLLALFALLLANFILAPILEFKPFNDGYEMVPSVTLNFKLLLVFVGFALFAGLLAGALPAWILSAFRPARILRGVGSERIMGNLSFRKILMVFQFSLSLVILIFLSTFYQQFNFMSHADLGFNHKNIVLIPSGSKALVTETAFHKYPGVTQTAFTSGRFGSADRVAGSRESANEQGIFLERYECNTAWLEMSQLQIIAGKMQLQHPSSVLINNSAAVALGFKNAMDAVGGTIYLQDSIPATITGVVHDFYSQGYGNPIQPMLFQRSSDSASYIAVEGHNVDGKFISALEQEWKKENPSHAFEYIWLDERMHADNDQSAEISLLGFLGFMTVTIAVLGLLGLVVYTVETRRKEVSIRKIIGASVNQIMTLLSRGFIGLLLLSGVVAFPIGYLLSQMFLTNFVNRIDIGFFDLTICFTLLLVCGLMAILSQTWKAAQENPSRNLRSE